ncbi:MAG: DUF4860 domain-containing protein [Firmicutes bacterium]|nr:DUF4860 domain-containing protein [Bacillota bacterium]
MRKQKSNISSLAPLLLFVIFTACILSVLLTGADVYQKFSERDQHTFQRRTTAQYLTTRLRQSDAVDMTFVGDFHAPSPQLSGNTLFIREELGGRTFYTRIYCHDGYLRELFAEAGVTFEPEDGQKILEVNDLSFTVKEDLILIEIEHADAAIETLILYNRNGEEVLP